jgi:hypothetical protein
MTKISIGCRVTDTINGFTGLTTGRLEYLNGCRQFLVKPERLNKDGKPEEGIWIDEQNLRFEMKVLNDPFVKGSFAISSPKAGGPDRAERDLPR